MEMGALYVRLQGLGHIVEQIDSAIVRAHAKKLVETSGRRAPLAGEAMPPAIRAGYVGAYHVDRMPKLFTLCRCDDR
jgi:hypothetical protein